MKVLLDECLPKKLKREITGHDVVTVPEQGWAGKKNGELLGLAKTEFDVFITIDQNLTAQQNLNNIDLAIIVLASLSNRLEVLKPLIPKVQEALTTIQMGDVVTITL
jgi:predicted nuclease of predicted toxin-antitoxin system